jgi:GNAT superfamily N-acetyltransferase
MTATISICRATPGDAVGIAPMVGELLCEIMRAIGESAFNFTVEETTARLEAFIRQEKYIVYTAKDARADLLGFISIYESCALYAEGDFGTIPELYVRPAYRSQRVGMLLMAQAKAFGISRGWKRLEVTTPPLPQFDRTLAFYEREGFFIPGGRKLKVPLRADS